MIAAIDELLEKYSRSGNLTQEEWRDLDALSQRLERQQIELATLQIEPNYE